MEQQRLAEFSEIQLRNGISKADPTVVASSKQIIQEEPGGRPRINKKTVSVRYDVHDR